MQLRVARLCHDCEEIHADQHCPVCASETFTFITRWVPAPERRAKPRPATSPEAETFKQLLEPSKRARWITPAAVGVTALGVLGWLSRRNGPSKAEARTGGAARGDSGRGELSGAARPLDEEN